MNKKQPTNFQINMKALKDTAKIQCGVYTESDYDSYMHGMSNGLILAVALMEEKEPKFLEAFKDKKSMEHKAKVLADRPKTIDSYDH